MMKCTLPNGNIRNTIKYHHNLYLNKISKNTTELRGNITNTIPFGDALTVSL